MARKIPSEYSEALKEADRLFDEGLLTSELFDPLYEKASKAIDGLPQAGDLIEALLLLAPQDWLDANAEAADEGADAVA
jgi:hypothetical protein